MSTTLCIKIAGIYFQLYEQQKQTMDYFKMSFLSWLLICAAANNPEAGYHTARYSSFAHLALSLLTVVATQQDTVLCSPCSRSAHCGCNTARYSSFAHLALGLLTVVATQQDTVLCSPCPRSAQCGCNTARHSSFAHLALGLLTVIVTQQDTVLLLTLPSVC